MEFPAMGKHCEASSCNKLDFLPHTCKCTKIFCSEHYTTHILECPIMQKDFKVADLNAKSGMWKCSHPQCEEKSLVPLICEKCKQHFCVHHRHVTSCSGEDPVIKEAAIAKMRAPIAKFNEAKAKVDKELDESIKTASHRSKNKNDLAIKVQLMRIKNKATGQKDIPSTDRVYFNVTTPIQCGAVSRPVFVARTWTLGRVIDAIASECKVPNNNNVATAPKLCLFTALDDNESNLEDVSQKLNDLLISNVLIDGQNVKIEYVSK